MEAIKIKAKLSKMKEALVPHNLILKLAKTMLD